MKNILYVKLRFISSYSSISIDNSLFKLSKEKLYTKDFKRSTTYCIINILINYFVGSLFFVNNSYIFIIQLNINKIARREEKRREEKRREEKLLLFHGEGAAK